MMNDDDILDMIFTPGVSGVAKSSKRTAAVPAWHDGRSEESRRKEQLALVKSDRDGDIAGCVESLQALLVEDGGEECAKNASLMNNLAQALRLQQEDASDAEAVRLLTVAIALDASPDGRVKQNALCQRALLHEKRDEMDAARIDLEAAAALGSAFAKKELVRINPYSAMCNKIVKEAIGRLYT